MTSVFKEKISKNRGRSHKCGWMVIAGLIIEVGLAIAFRKDSWWLEVWSPVFADFLVALGVLGEIYFANEAGKDEEKLQNESEEKIASLIKLAADANVLAKKLENDAAQARLETQKVKQQLAWRELTQQQVVTLTASLRGNDFEVWTAWVGNDPEATLYRGQIDAALTTAGIRTKYFSGFTRAMGLSITNVPGNTFNLLIDAFSRAEIPFRIEQPDPQILNGQLAIIIGTKPPPDL